MIDLSRTFKAVESAVKAHGDLLAALLDPRARELATTETPTSAAACREFWDSLDKAFSESRTIATLREKQINESHDRHTVFAVNFGNAAIRLDDALHLTSERIRATLASPDRPMLDREQEAAKGVMDAILAAQAELLAAHALHASMAPADGGQPLAIAYK